MKQLQLPFQEGELAKLKAGDTVLLSGEILTARDAAHARLTALLAKGSQLPVNLAGAAIYYVGACPAKPGQVIGSCGPTSALRMDTYAPILFDNGVVCTIAKGPVAQQVVDSIVKNKAVYLCATGGAGALLSKCVKSEEVVAFAELGTEAISRLVVEDMPLIVGIDSKGESLFT